MTSRFSRARRLVTRVVCVLLLAIALAAAAACPGAANFLIIDDPLVPADAIVVLAGARVERWLEAADLYREGRAPAILLSTGIVEPAEMLLRQQGIHFPSETELAKNAMVQMGIPAAAISAFPVPVDNTADEAAVTRGIAQARGWRRLIVVTSKYHTRRSRFAFEREFDGAGVDVQVRGSRYDEVQPDGWWRSRSDFRFVTSELQKLVAYRLGLGR